MSRLDARWHHGRDVPDHRELLDQPDAAVVAAVIYAAGWARGRGGGVAEIQDATHVSPRDPARRRDRWLVPRQAHNADKGTARRLSANESV
jgi:hypothetical protein